VAWAATTEILRKCIMRMLEVDVVEVPRIIHSMRGIWGEDDVSGACAISGAAPAWH
jgi:hypothetical protein